MPTKIIDNFTGRLTRKNSGDSNSGLAKYATTFGNNPFSNPGDLSWMENPTAISGGIITDLVMAAIARGEGPDTFVYAIGHTGRLYKIQVTNSAAFNPNYNNAILLTTITINSPTFLFGGSISIYGSVPRLYIGHDIGVTQVDIDGTNETFVGTVGSWQSVDPRPAIEFQGSLYFGNGNNLAKMDSTLLITSYAVLSPAFPFNTIVRDLDVSPDGNYLQIIVSTVFPPVLTSVTQSTLNLRPAASYLMLWNGSDTGVTSYTSYNGYSITSNIAFGRYGYFMGYDLGSAAIYSQGEKIVSLPTSLSPNFEATFSTGNLLGFVSPDYDVTNAKLSGSLIVYGQYDQEISKGLFRFFKFDTSAVGFEITSMPSCVIASNLLYGNSQAGFANNQVGAALLYFSVLGISSGSPVYKFYAFTTVPTGSGTAIAGVYETQQEILSSKSKPNSVRFYTEPLVANNSFKIDIIGSDGNPMSGGSKTFTVGSNVTAGQDYVWYTPVTAPTYSMGFRITNLGTVNWTGIKLEVDYEEAGV